MTAITSACATASSPQDLQRARAQAEAGGESCPQHEVVAVDRAESIFLVMGCNAVSRVRVLCDDKACSRRVLASRAFAQPARLKSEDQTLWRSLEPVAADAPAAEPVQVTPVTMSRNLTDIGDPRMRPSLPREFEGSGAVVWGLYRICVDHTGQVRSVQILQSALPGGFDASWIAKIENWRYKPYQVNGRPMPFCAPLRVQVQAS